ncbi:MAG TPA: hypothetical protein VMT78_13390 [Terriglobia bacterium]|jgi:hypothetical protein|nr:hypothetical protein [Terriglobia bacterium]
MKRLIGVTLIALTLGLTACTSANTADKEEVSGLLEVKPDDPKITVPSGTPLRVVLQQGVGTDASAPGSQFAAVLADPIVVDGRTVLEKGSAVSGRVVDVKKSGRVKGRATLSLALTSVLHEGKYVPIETQTYVGVAKDNKKRDAAMIGGGAGVGALIGAIAGGGKGAATGAAIGGGGGTGAVLATRGDDLHYPPESRLKFVLSKEVEL